MNKEAMHQYTYTPVLQDTTDQSTDAGMANECNHSFFVHTYIYTLIYNVTWVAPPPTPGLYNVTVRQVF